MPKRRSHHEPTYAKTHSPIKKSLTSSLSSHYSSKVSAMSQRKENPAARFNLFFVPYKPSSILTSWDDSKMKIVSCKKKPHSLRKKITKKEASISLKSIFNQCLKKKYFRIKIASFAFEKHYSASCISNRVTSRNDRDNIYDSTFI